MLKKAHKARWSGANADVTRPFVKAVADEIEDAHTEAKDPHKELNTAYHAFKSIQDDLQTMVDAARHKGIDISDGKDGKVICKYLPQPGHQNEDLPKEKLRELRTLEKDLSALVTRANNRDSYTPIAEHGVQLQQRIPRAGQPVRDLGAGEHSEAFLPGGKEVHEMTTSSGRRSREAPAR